jgi:hypothetical protein
MDSKNITRFPPLRKNPFNSKNNSIAISGKKPLHIFNDIPKGTYNFSTSPSKILDLKVSPRYLNYHKNIINKSRVTLTDEIINYDFPQKPPIKLVNIIDFELERWRFVH